MQASLNIILYALTSASSRIFIMFLTAVSFYVLSIESFEFLAVILSFAPLYTYILDFAISKATVRYWYLQDDSTMLNNYLSSIIKLRFKFYFFIIPALFIFSLITWAVVNEINLNIFLSVVALILYGIAESSFLFITSYFRLYRDPLTLFKTKISVLLISFIITISIYYFIKIDFMFLIYSSTYFLLTILFISILLINKNINSFNPVSLSSRSILRFSFPLTIHDISWWLKGFAITLIVANYSSPIYSSGFFIALLVISPLFILISGADQAYAADYYEAKTKGVSLVRIKQIYRRLTLFVVLIFLISLILLSYIESYVQDNSLKIAIELMPILFLGPIFHSCYVVWIKPLMYSKKTKKIGTLSFLISLSTFVVCFLYYELYDYIFAALASSFSFLLIGLSMYFLTIIDKEEIFDSSYQFVLISFSLITLYLYIYLELNISIFLLLLLIVLLINFLFEKNINNE